MTITSRKAVRNAHRGEEYRPGDLAPENPPALSRPLGAVADDRVELRVQPLPNCRATSMTERPEFLRPQPAMTLQVARTIENDDVTYRVAAHHPEGFMVHVVWNWAVVLLFLALDWFVLRHAGADRLGALLAGAVLSVLTVVSVAVAFDQMWWRRVCIEGSEVIVLRDASLVHLGSAYGRSRQWHRPFDDVRRVMWRPRGSHRQYVSSVAVWRSFPNMYVVGFGLDNESGQWLADELAARARGAGRARWAATD